MACPPRSAWMAGTNSHRTHSLNGLSSHIRCSTWLALVIIACPATLSTEYSLIRPSASSGPHALTMPLRSISQASPPAEGKTSTGVPNVPHRTTVMSCSRRLEYHRSVALRSSLIDVLLRSWEYPRQSFPEPVTPVFPAVPVPGLDVTDGHPGRLEHRHHRPVRHDQRLVDAAADEHPVRDPPRARAVPVDEPHHRLERRAAAVVVTDVGEDERAGLQQQRPVELRVPVRGRQRGHGAEARAHQAA